MKTIYKKILFFVFLVILNIIIYNAYTNVKNINSSLLNDYKNLNKYIYEAYDLRSEFNSLKNIVIEENKNFIIEDYIQNILDKLNIRLKIVHFKTIRKNEYDLFDEVYYELRINNISIEELIKLLYNIEIIKSILKIEGINATEIIQSKYNYDALITFKHTIFKK